MRTRRPTASPRTVARLLLAAMLLAPAAANVAPPALRAQACGAETEPNDVEAEIQPRAGL